MGSKIRAIALVMIAPLIALTVGMSLALTSAAVEEPVTAVFTGVATTGNGQGFPIDVDSDDVVMREDGAIGLAYTYAAAGQVTSGLSGHFTYEETGRIYLMDPSDPTTLVGSELFNAEFSLLPTKPSGSVVVISDTCSECYESGQAQAHLSELPAWARDFAVKSLVTGGAGTGGNPMVNYGYFTFTNEHGEFTGYSTPSSDEFVIQLTFDPDSEGESA